MNSPRTHHPRDPNVTAISDLDIFARVARTGNMSMAGREMGLSPAVVSKRISLLEDRLAGPDLKIMSQPNGGQCSAFNAAFQKTPGAKL